MLDLQRLNSLREQVRPPSYAELTTVARRRDRRTALLAAAGSAAVVVAVVVGALLTTNAGEDSAPPPVITPTPSPSPSPSPPPTHHSATSMTPREVVQADNAQLQWTAVSADDPDFRVSVWEAECTWCPRQPESRFPHPSFMGMAITSDGFATTTYRHTGLLEFEEGGLRPLYAVSPGPGLILLVDDSNGGEWLVRDDGTVTPQARSSVPLPNAKAQASFVCLTDFEHAPWANPGIPSDAWCTLDADRNTVREMGRAWWGSYDVGRDTPPVVNPASRTLPWGLRNKSLDSLVAWWDVGGTRHSKDFGQADASGAVGNAPAGVMSYWAWRKGSPTLTVFTSSDQGSSWQQSTLPVPYRPIDPYAFDLSWTPDGALLGREEDALEVTDSSGNVEPGIRLWRSAGATGNPFTKVYEGPSGSPAHGVVDPAFTVVGSRIWSRGLWSDDDGNTWSRISRWR